MTLRSSDLQSDSDLDSIRNSCDVCFGCLQFQYCAFSRPLNENLLSWLFVLLYFIALIVKDCLLTMVKSRLALGSPGCSFGRSFVTMPKMAQYTGKWLLLPPSGHIQSETLFSDHTRPGKRNEWSSQSFAQLTLGLVTSDNQIQIQINSQPKNSNAQKHFIVRIS